MTEGSLQKKAEEAIRTGRMPDAPPARMWGGRGFGVTCPVCTRTVQPDEVGYELEFDAAVQGPDECALHVQCFLALEAESERRTARAPLRQSGALPAREGGGNIDGRARHGHE